MSKAYTSEDNIVRVIECYKLGLSTKEISHQTGVKPVTVRRLIVKFKSSGEREIPHHLHGGGWRPKISGRTLAHIKRQLDQNPHLTARQLKEQNPMLLQDVSVRTIQKNIQTKLNYRKMRARNKPFVSEVHRKKRLAFVQKYSSWTLDEWRRVLWTDEATFRVSDTKGKKVWRRKGSDPHDPKFTAKSVKHPPSLMAWGAFSYGGVADLHIFPKGQSVTKDVYLSLLDSRLADCFAATGGEVLHQDGAPCHTAHIVKEWLVSSQVECIPDWPANSPDMSPIENLWGIVKCKLRNEDTSTLPKLECALRRAWSSVSQETVEKLADSLPSRLMEVRKRKGYPISK